MDLPPHMSIDRLVEIIVRQVLSELAKRGVRMGNPGAPNTVAPAMAEAGRVKIDMTGYRTPVLTENRVRSLEPHVREILVPAGTVCTIGARDAMQLRRITLTYTSTTP